MLRERESRGGSTYVHERLHDGSTVRVRGPRNHFPLVAAPRYRFVAGGIGITPILPMVAEAEASGADWHLTYGGRTRASMAFTDRLAPYGDRVTLAPQDETGLLDLRTRQGLYSEQAKGVEISDGVLYRARIEIPSQVPVGTYTAETFLIDDGRVVAAATKDIEIGKSGFERFVSLAAKRHGFLYGLAAVLLSLGLGWAAARAFAKRG